MMSWLQAWLEAYHFPQQQQQHMPRGGAIQQAIIVRADSGHIGSVEIGIVGTDGQLAILDLPQLAAFYARTAAGIQPYAEVRALRVPLGV